MENFIRIAADHINPDSKNQHVTLITHKKKIISIGANSYNKTTPFFKEVYSFRHNRIHSESAALKKVRYYKHLDKCELWNFRFSRIDGSLLLSYPCESCLQLIGFFNIRKVYFSTPTGMCKI
jgi:deoxycytidylate deaminase